MVEPLDNIAAENTPSRPILPIHQALIQLRPGCRWHLEGYYWEGLVWEDDPSLKPTQQEVESLAQQMVDALPMKELRRQRDRRFREVDWVTLRATRTGEPIPQEWQDYMNALADITETCPNVKLVNGELINVTWPERPDGVPAGPWKPGMLRG